MRWRDFDGVGSAGADGAAGSGAERFVEADFYGGEVVVAAGEGEVLLREVGVGLGDEGEDLRGWQGDLVVEVGEGGWDDDGLEGGAGGGEVGVGGEAGAGAVGLPFVLEEAGVGVDVGVLGGVGGAGGGGAVLRVGAVGVLGPEAVEDEGGVAGALDVGGVRVAVLG